MKSIKLLVYDFDGVMTDNKVYVDQHGNEMVQVNRADGLGVAEIRKLGIQQIILSTETNPVIKRRAEKIGIPCIQGVSDKKHDLILYCQDKDIVMKQVMYVGNDLNDMEAMKAVGYPMCPADAHLSIKAIAIKTLESKGGEGVIRELYDILQK